MKPTLPFTQALADRALLGRLRPFRRGLATWRGLVAFVRAFLGEPQDPEGRAWLTAHTGGRTTFPAVGFREAVAVVGRQSGKTTMASALASYTAVTCQDSGSHVVLVAQDSRSSQRTLMTGVRECFKLPALRGEVVRTTADTLELRSGVSLSVYPCKPSSVRGLRSPLIVLDEMAFYQSSEGAALDREMLRAVRPCLAATGGRLLVLSSPYSQAGALWDLFRANFGKDDARVLVMQASAAELNPLLSPGYLSEMRETDPEAYASEVLGEFRSGVSTLLDSEVLDRCVPRGVFEVPPQDGVVYRAHFDPSGGRADAAALAIGHRDDADVSRLDCLRTWRAPHDPLAVAGEVASVLRTYGLAEVQVDRFGGDYPLRSLEAHGVRAFMAERTTSEHFMGLLPVANSGRLRLLDLPDLLRELRGLERRRGTAGRDSVGHRSGAHDDTAAALAGVVALLSGQTTLLDVSQAFTDTTRSLRQGATADADGVTRWENGTGLIGPTIAEGPHHGGGSRRGRGLWGG